jgi:hypothetical protein
MKKYRLIKEYPWSDKLGIIVDYDYSRYPEYWEEVKDEFKTINFNTDGTMNTILRLSDMHYFSVGDWFYPTAKSSEPNIILEFKYVLNGGFRVIGTNSCVSLSGITATKNKAQQYEISGNMLYSWDKVWGVNPKSFKRNFVKYGRKEDGVPVYIASVEDNYIWFTSMEEAEDYIVMNKPCLAIVDIYDAFPKGKLNYFKKIVNERTQNK